MRITPDIASHITLEDAVKSYLRQRDFLTDAMTYHSVMDKDICRRLSEIYTPTSLYIRGRADRIAVHKTQPAVFEWEAKTHDRRDKHDMLVEALPLCHHIANARLGVRCLYVYQNPYREQECGFWVSQLPAIQVVMIPNRWDNGLGEWFEETISEYLPNVRIVSIGRTRGSDDPFAIIDEKTVKELPHWSLLIDSLMRGIARWQP